MRHGSSCGWADCQEFHPRRFDSVGVIKSTATPTEKPVLRIGAYHHAVASDAIADFPLRLEHNRAGIYYWAMARSGEYHWWLVDRM